MQIFRSIVKRQPVKKGWSGDKKFCAETPDGTKYLLRIADPSREDRFYKGFSRMQQAAELGIPMNLPIEFGHCEEGVYAIHSWIDGEDAEAYIPPLPEQQQYAYGLDAGKILKKLHSLPPPENAQPWEIRYGAKIDRKIRMYQECPLKYDNGQLFLSFLEENRHLISSRPQSYQHGDYHIGNMMIDHNGILTVIDFERDDYGDPWEEFNRIIWCAQAAPMFASGMVDGYFDHQVPADFWNLLALYITTNTVSSLPWAVSFGESEITTMRSQAAQILQWYDNMKSTVPGWYCKGGKSL